MITVKELYNKLDSIISPALSCSWDNDGLMVCPDEGAEVKLVLLALDLTKDTIKHAKSISADLIVTHHPLIFRPVKALNGRSFTSSKAIELIKSGISVFSFHTRLDALDAGVNHTLAQTLGVRGAIPFGEERMARIGSVDKTTLEVFAKTVKESLGADHLRVIDASRPVERVALCGGDGKDFLEEAILAGADTYVTGSMSYNSMLDACDFGVNVIEAGHYFTEAPVLAFLESLIKEADPSVSTARFCSNAVKLVI